MEVIVIDGVEYVKASVVAKRFRYTADYVGQLCRSGKVVAKLVGRTWYVANDSISGHKTTRYSKTSSDDKTKLNKAIIETSRINESLEKPVLSDKKTPTELPRIASRRQSKSVVGSNYLTRVNWKPAKYESDETELIPPITAVNTKTVRLEVDLAEAEKLRVKSQTSNYSELTPESLPSVALGGALKVKSMDNSFEVDETDFTLKNIDRTHKQENIDEVKRSTQTKVDKEKKLPTVINSSSKKNQKYTYNVNISRENNHLTINSNQAVSFTPELVRQRKMDKEDPITSRVDNPWLEFILRGLCLMVLVGLFAVIFIEQFTILESNTGLLDSSYRFDFKNIYER